MNQRKALFLIVVSCVLAQGSPVESVTMRHEGPPGMFNERITFFGAVTQSTGVEGDTKNGFSAFGLDGETIDLVITSQ